MIARVNREKDGILAAFNASRIDYAGAYLHLYASYNAWYRSVTGESLDAVAIGKMKQRYEMWAEYLSGDCLQLLRSPMRRMYVLSQHRPLIAASGRDVMLEDDCDWRHLIDIWYVVRCDIVHGATSTKHSYYDQFIRLAYESLSVYMTEVVYRIRIQMRATQLDSPAARRAFVTLPESHLVDQIPRQQFETSYISLRSPENTV